MRKEERPGEQDIQYLSAPTLHGSGKVHSQATNELDIN